MFDDQSIDPARTCAWQEHLSWGDIVLFRFPMRLPHVDETAKARPCLVLETPSFGLSRYAMVAYGTSADSSASRGHEIDVRGAEAAAAGLARDTRFVGARRILVPLEHEGFLPIGTTRSPVIGRLSGQSFERMNAVRARIAAEADIAADRRAQRRRVRPKRREPHRPVIVIRKTPKRLSLPRPTANTAS